MNARHLKTLGASALMLSALGCNNIEAGLVVLHVAAPEDNSCSFSADGDTVLADIHYDAEFANTMWLNLRVQNNLQSGSVDFTEDTENPDTFQIPSSVTPLRFDLRWECDSNGFSSNLGALYLPQFSAEDQKPFCLDSRDQTSGDFSGFDVIPANGGAIEGGGIGLVSIRPITTQLGSAFRDFFEMATTAELCCSAEQPTGCDDASLMAKASAPSCDTLQRLFDATAGQGNLSAQSSDDVNLFRPFAQFDVRPGTPGAANRAAGQLIGPSYPLRMRGVLEGVTATGELTTSTEFTDIIHVCRGCAVYIDDMGSAFGGTPCTQL